MAQIEPVNILGQVGEYLKTYHAHSPYNVDKLHAEILDIDGNILFRTMVYATNIDEVANQLNLKLIK